MHSIPKDRPYYKALDGLRFLASLNIVLLHMASSESLGMLQEFPRLLEIIKAPLLNASVFFVLGGFIYHGKVSAQLESFDTRRFLKKRLRQLYPLHFVSTLLMLALYVEKNPSFRDYALLSRTFLAHATLTWPFVSPFVLELNGPSWALTPFFLAYLTLKPFARTLNQEWSSIKILLAAGLCLVPSLWTTWLYAELKDAPGAYLLFHTMPLVRVCEFYLGMILSRLRYLHAVKSKRPSGWRSDFGVILSVFLLWFSLRYQNNHGYLISWLTHHVLRLILYGFLIWNLTTNIGIFNAILAWSPLSKIGQASFYPYLLHLPLITATYALTRAWGYHALFTQKWHLYAFLLFLYGSGLWFNHQKKASLRLCANP